MLLIKWNELWQEILLLLFRIVSGRSDWRRYRIFLIIFCVLTPIPPRRHSGALLPALSCNMAVCALFSFIFVRISRASFIALTPIFIRIAFPWIHNGNRNGGLGTQLLIVTDILVSEWEVTLVVGEIELRPGANIHRARSPLPNHLRFTAIVILPCEIAALLFWTVQIIVLLWGWKPRRLCRPFRIV